MSTASFRNILALSLKSEVNQHCGEALVLELTMSPVEIMQRARYCRVGRCLGSMEYAFMNVDCAIAIEAVGSFPVILKTAFTACKRLLYSAEFRVLSKSS